MKSKNLKRDLILFLILNFRKNFCSYFRHLIGKKNNIQLIIIAIYGEAILLVLFFFQDTFFFMDIYSKICNLLSIFFS
jgi:hypothetical protein